MEPTSTEVIPDDQSSNRPEAPWRRGQRAAVDRISSRRRTEPGPGDACPCCYARGCTGRAIQASFTAVWVRCARTELRCGDHALASRQASPGLHQQLEYRGNLSSGPRYKERGRTGGKSERCSGGGADGGAQQRRRACKPLVLVADTRQGRRGTRRG